MSDPFFSAHVGRSIELRLIILAVYLRVGSKLGTILLKSVLGFHLL